MKTVGFGCWVSGWFCAIEKLKQGRKRQYQITKAWHSALSPLSLPAVGTPVTIPIAGTDVGLRGLVQHVLSPIAPSAIFPKLDYFQALGDKTLYVRHRLSRPYV